MKHCTYGFDNNEYPYGQDGLNFGYPYLAILIAIFLLIMVMTLK